MVQGSQEAGLGQTGRKGPGKSIAGVAEPSHQAQVAALQVFETAPDHA